MGKIDIRVSRVEFIYHLAVLLRWRLQIVGFGRTPCPAESAGKQCPSVQKFGASNRSEY